MVLNKNRDDKIRKILSHLILIYFFCFIFLVLGVGAFGTLEIEESIDIILIVCPVLTGFIGNIIGFYFGSKQEA